jgi:hypothetical protein
MQGIKFAFLIKGFNELINPSQPQFHEGDELGEGPGRTGRVGYLEITFAFSLGVTIVFVKDTSETPSL